MRVKAIRLQNFMGFQDTNWIELRPITLLFGRNSSGKSAIIRALLLLRQSLQTEIDEPLAFIAENGADLGSFEQVVHNREIKDSGKPRKITFSFRCEVSDEVLRKIEPANPLDLHRGCVDLSLSFWWNESDKVVEIAQLQLETAFVVSENLPDKRTILLADFIGETQRRTKEDEWVLASHFFDPHFLAPEDQTWLAGLEISKYRNRFATDEYEESFLPNLHLAQGAEGTDAVIVQNIFIKCRNAISEWLDEQSFRHLGPIRLGPRRTYLLSELSRHKWDATGQAAIVDFALKVIRKKTSGQDKQRIQQWFDRLGLGQVLIPKPINPNETAPDAFQIEISETSYQTNVNLRDVGYGASQVLPVILQCVFAPKKAFVMVEQPELHLHTEAQANLADLFIESLNETRGEEGSPTRFYLIETHSETFFLRLRVELAKTSAGIAEKSFYLEPEDFICHFIERDPLTGISSADQILFDDKGEFSKRPERFFDFFGQDFRETLELRKARSLKKE